MNGLLVVDTRYLFKKGPHGILPILRSQVRSGLTLVACWRWHIRHRCNVFKEKREEIAVILALSINLQNKNFEHDDRFCLLCASYRLVIKVSVRLWISLMLRYGITSPVHNKDRFSINHAARARRGLHSLHLWCISIPRARDSRVISSRKLDSWDRRNVKFHYACVRTYFQSTPDF